MVNKYPISEIQVGDKIESPKGNIGKVVRLIPYFNGEFKVKIDWFYNGEYEWSFTSDLENYEIIR